MSQGVKSVERPLEVEKFELFEFDHKIFLGWNIEKSWCVGFERMI